MTRKKERNYWLSAAPLLMLGIGFEVIAAITLVVTVRNALARGWSAEQLIGFAVPLVFGLFGTLVLCLGWRFVARKQEEARQRLEFPDQPWMWRRDWASGTMEDSPWIMLSLRGGFVLLWNLVTWAVAAQVLLARSEHDDAGIFLLIIAVFGVAGFCGASYWIKLFRRTAYWGTLRLELDHVPAAIGGSCSGRLVIDRTVDDRVEFRLALVCQEFSRDKVMKLGSVSFSNPEATFKTHWISEHVIRERLSRSGDPATVIPVSFDIPADAPPVSTDPCIDWELRITARNGPRRADRMFEIPVYRIADTPQQQRVRAQPARAIAEPETWLAYVDRSNYSLLENSDDRIVLSSRSSTVPERICRLGIAIAIAGLGAWLANRAELRWLFYLIFPIAAIIYFLIEFSTTRITVEPGRIGIRWQLFEFSWDRALPSDQVSRLMVDSLHVNMVEVFRVYIVTVRKKEILLMDRLPEEAGAHAIADAITKLLVSRA